ncbi:MAG TPA: ATP-binding protein, partial [Planctomycetaceae bacterium]|nr:ATP-binding protein [Planctomycetaceae bacterium]
LEVRAEQLRNSLLSSVSHDLRTPLATIAGTSSSLLEGESSPTRRESLQIVVDESRRLARLVDNLLDMAKLESGQVSLDRQWHVIEELVGSALSRVQSVLQCHSIRTVVPADLPLLYADGLLLEQLLVNLLENAARHTPPGSEVEIAARKCGDQMEIHVADNGPGLPSGTEHKIFEKFFQANRLTPDGRRGVGLGLAISRSIVEAHGGHIQARNRASGGAEFVIRLPNQKPPPPMELDVVQ